MLETGRSHRHRWPLPSARVDKLFIGHVGCDFHQERLFQRETVKLRTLLIDYAAVGEDSNRPSSSCNSRRLGCLEKRR